MFEIMLFWYIVVSTGFLCVATESKNMNHGTIGWDDATLILIGSYLWPLLIVVAYTWYLKFLIRSNRNGVAYEK